MASTNISTVKFLNVSSTPAPQLNSTEKLYYYMGRKSFGKPVICICLAVFGVFVVIGVTLALVFVLLPGHCDTVKLGSEIRNGNDHVGLIFTTCPSKSAYDGFVNAAAFWSGVVNGSEFRSIRVNQKFDTANTFCQSIVSVVFEAGTVFDHLTIIAEIVGIDGPRKVVAGAGPCNMFVNGIKQIPLLGLMIFDFDDLDRIEEDGTFEKLVLHEMAHVLGFGTLWQRIKEGGLQSNVKTEELLQDPIFDDNGFTFSSNHPKFIGTNAIDEFSLLKEENRTFVPVEDGDNEFGDDFFEPQLDEGRGSIDRHWKKTTFGDELMTFEISPNDNRHPISRVTLAAIEDAGYAVDYSFAEDYELPVPSASRQAPGNLRGKATKGFDLTGDARLFKGFHDEINQDIYIREI